MVGVDFNNNNNNRKEKKMINYIFIGLFMFFVTLGVVGVGLNLYILLQVLLLI
jgi:hypothetical protein